MEAPLLKTFRFFFLRHHVNQGLNPFNAKEAITAEPIMIASNILRPYKR
jgi:hypothetical protein